MLKPASREKLLRPAARTASCRWVFALIAGACLFSSIPSDSFGQFGQNKVQYKSFQWQVLKTEHFDIYFYEKERPMVLDAAKMAERAFTRYSNVLNYKPKRRIPLILYASHSDFSQTNVLPEEVDEGLAGVNEFMKKRVILPSTGSWHDFEHVLTHELAHAFQIDILWGDTTPISNPFAFSPPLWFIEGMVEQLSIDDMTPNHEMWLRDSALNGYLMSLSDLGYMGGGAYTFGHAFWYFIAQRYGTRKIGEILQKTSVFGNLDNAFKSAVGAKMKTLSEQWNEDIRKTYLPQIVHYEKPESFSRKLTDHTRDGSGFNTSPALNSSGEIFAWFTNKSGYIDIRSARAIDGKRGRTLVGGQRNPDMENIRFIFTSLDWSDDDRFLTYVAKSGAEDAIFVYNYYNRKVVNKFATGLDDVVSPSFSPDGKKIVFSGIDGGRSNLYTIEIDSGKLTRITDDQYTERDPVYSPDGKKIAFTTEYGPGTDLDNLIFADYRIAILDLATGQYELLPNSYGNNFSPQWSPDGSELAYVSDRSGIFNIYYHDFKDGREYQVTNVITGISGITETSPCISWSSGSGRMAFSAFFNSGWDIYIVNNPEGMAKPWEPDTTMDFNYETVYLNATKSRKLELRRQLRAEAGQEETITSLANRKLEEARPLLTAGAPRPAASADKKSWKMNVASIASDTLMDTSVMPVAGSVPELDSVVRTTPPRPLDPVDSATAADTSHPAVADTAAPDTLPAAVTGETGPEAESPTDSMLIIQSKPDTLPAISFDFEVAKKDIPLPDTSSFTYNKYKPKFSIDYVSGYGGYMGNIGATGGVFLALSDNLGNHNFEIGANIYGKVQDSDLFFQYMNLKNRTNYGFFLAQFRDLYYNYYNSPGSSQSYLANIWRGTGLIFSRPFNRFRRLEFGASAYMLSQKAVGYSFDYYNYYTPPREYTVQEYGKIYFAGPNVALVYDNTAYGITGPVDGGRYRLSAQQFFGEVSYSEVIADWRKYWLFWRRVTLAFRGIGGVRWGKDPRLFYIGGPYTYRGAWYGDLLGNKLFLGNAELRFPLIDYLVLGWPVPVFLRGIGGVFFFDLAGAWFENEPFQPFTGSNAKWFKLKDAQAAYGFGLRMNLGYLILRLDMAKTLDHYDTNYYAYQNQLFKSVEKVNGRHRSFFSIGSDF